MKFLLYSNACIGYINGHPPQLREQIDRRPADDIAISTIAMAEMYARSAGSDRPRRSREMQNRFFSRFTTLPFDTAAALEYGWIHAFLKRRGQMIEVCDIRIAAIALAHDLTVVTHNLRHFQRVPSLQLEDWEAA